MKKILFPILSLVLLSSAVVAQSDVCVFLTDGNVMKGILIHHSTDKGMELLVADTTSIFLPYSIIAKVGSCQKNDTKNVLKPEQQVLAKGWYNHFVIQSLWGDDVNESMQVSYSLLYAKGYQWNEHFGAGLGMSIDFYDRMFTSLLLETRGQLYSDKSTPYYVLRGGYVIPMSLLSDNENAIAAKNGWLLHPAIGMQFASKKNSNFSMELGFRWQHYEEKPVIWRFTDVTDRITYYRTTISFGWRF